MEWNQPAYKGGMITDPVPLAGEVIRIGAVKLDENLHELGQYHICIIPKYYKKMNTAVKRVTGLANSSITYGLRFPVAYENFRKWCGEDCVFCTWGSEDEKILLSNLQIHGISADDLPKTYDLQIIFAHRITCDGKQYGVSGALGYYELPEDLKAHDALNDAIFTARIARKMDFPKYLSEYEDILKVIEQKRQEKYYLNVMGIESTEAALKHKKLTFARCPNCRKVMKMDKYTVRTETLAFSKAVCKTHGEYYVRLKLTLCPDNTYSATRKLVPMNAQTKEICEKISEETV